MKLDKLNRKLEFNKISEELENILINICSMLNKNGYGMLYLYTKIEEENYEEKTSLLYLNSIKKYIKNSIKPEICPLIKEEILNKKIVFKIIFVGNERPYSSNEKYYITNNKKENITNTELKNIISIIDYLSIWENDVTTYQIKDIDSNALKDFYNKMISTKKNISLKKYNEKELLIMLDLIKNDRITNACYFLFSSKKPIMLEMNVYLTDRKNEILDSKVKFNNIYNLINIAVDYIKSHIKWEAKFNNQSGIWIESSEFPIEIINEIILNSFVYANYQSFKLKYKIDITPTTIDVYNLHEIPVNYNLESLVENNLELTQINKKILDTLSYLKTKKRNLKEILELCSKNNIKYKFYNDKIGFKFSFYRNNNVHKINELDSEVLKLLKKDPFLTKNEIAKELGKDVRIVQKSLDKLSENEKIIKIENKISEK